MIEMILDTKIFNKHFENGKYYIHLSDRDIVPEGRPISFPIFTIGKYILNDILHFWLVDQNIVYFLKEDEDLKTHIFFKKESDAILFKLTWM